MQAEEHNPLVKEVPGNLFQFEERIFGMRLPQLLCTIGAGVGILTITGPLPPVARSVVCALLVLPALLLIHGKMEEQPFLNWFLLYARSFFIARHTRWQSLAELQGKKRGREPSVQTTWIALDSLQGGIAGYSEPGARGAAGRYWVVLECEGRNVRYLPQADQVKTFGRYETFLCGLEFSLQFISHVAQVDPADYEPLRVQKRALATLAHTPNVARLQQASIGYQEQHLQHCTQVRHFVVVAASAREEVARRIDGERQGPLTFLWRRIFRREQAQVPREQVLDQLRIRVSVLKQILQQLDVRSRLLDDPDLLQQFATCLALGAQIPAFRPHTVEEAAVALAGLGAPVGADHARTRRRVYRRRISGLHGTFLYKSTLEQARFEAGALRLADLVAPSRIDVEPEVLVVDVAGQKRYQRYFHIVGYGHQLLCGWIGDLTEWGLPMVIATTLDPLDSRYMIDRLETQLVRLESRKIADLRRLGIGRASRTIEAEQIRRVTHALAGRRMKVFAVEMTIGIHASSRERLDQRTRYLLSHLRQKQLKVRTARHRQDRSWQATLPTCPRTELEVAVNLPSDVLSSFLAMSSGSIGTPTGVFLGFVESGSTRRPVYFNPWSEDKRLPNPHIVVLGDSGQGKSFLDKVLVTGLMGMGIADVVVLDKDDDFLLLHHELGAESQRFDLARGCPINFFDLPFGPRDIDPDDPSDRLVEFIDNQLLVGLTLLLCDEDSRLSQIEEAYLMRIAREVYAAAGITGESIRFDPSVLLRPMPTLADFIAAMKAKGAPIDSMQVMQESLIERLEKASYLFGGQTAARLDRPLTIFSIHELDQKWYPLMTFTVQNFLMRHRAMHQDERYLAYVVEEASYMLKHPAARKALEMGARGFRKLAIAQITSSQHPQEFINEGAVVLNNCSTSFYLGMQKYAVSALHLPEELEYLVTNATVGQLVMRVGNEYAAVTITASGLHRRLFATTQQERRKQRAQAQTQQSHATHAPAS